MPPSSHSSVTESTSFAESTSVAIDQGASVRTFKGASVNTFRRAAQTAHLRSNGDQSLGTRRSVRRACAVLCAVVVISVIGVVPSSATAETLHNQVAVEAPAMAAAVETAMVTDSRCSTHVLPRNDDGSTGAISLPFRVNFYGANKTQLYVNNNGNVTFNAPLGTYTPFEITASTPPMIAAFFADIDTRGGKGIVTYGVSTFAGRQALCVNWRHVGYFSGHTDKMVDVQLYLVNNNPQGDFDIVLNYGSIRWETGDASGATGGLGGISAGAGFSNGDGNPAHFYQVPGSLVNGAFLDSNGSTGLASHSNLTPAIPGRYVFHIASGQSVSLANTCNPNYFVSVRGSGETSTGPDDQGKDSAKVTYAVYKGVESYYLAHSGTSAKLAFYQIPYQALGVEVLSTNLDHGSLSAREDQFFSTNLPRYMGSISEGVAQLRGYLDSVDRICASQHRSTRFILSGYSQGALVIHQYLNQLSGAQFASMKNQIGGVALVADPATVSNSAVALNWGSSAASDYGICQASVVILTANSCGSGNPQADIPTVFAGVTELLCSSGDIVCDTSKTTGDWLVNMKADAERGIRIHTSYPTSTATELTTLGKVIASHAHMAP